MIYKVGEMGCCFGVKNAIKTALLAKKENPDENLYFNHELVHNKKTIEELDPNKEIGIYNLSKETKDTSNSILVFSAHGHTLKEEEKSKKFKTTYDALCPLLKNDYNKLSKTIIKENEIYLFYGSGKHPETYSIVERFPFLKLIDKNEDLIEQLNKIEDVQYKSIYVYNQSTILDIPKEIITKVLKDNGALDINFSSSCKVLEQRQKVVSKISQKYNNDNNCFIVIGDSLSSNANELLNFVKKKFSYTVSFLINDEQELPGKLNYENFFIVSSTSVTKNRCDLIIQKLQLETKQTIKSFN